jgi:protein-S-isoprenylcysteine O-methyltransferase Ste14
MTQTISEENRTPTPQLTWVGDLFGRIAIVLVFGMGISGKSNAVYNHAQEWLAAKPGFDALKLLSEMASLCFLILVVSTTIVRLKPLRSADGIEPRFTALAGTFATAFIILIPPTVALTPALEIAALGLTAVGFFLSAYVLFWLGRSFSIMAEARRLVTAGPYRFVRHPLYAVEEIAIIGVLLLNLSLPAVLLIAAQWAFQLRRMHNEELVLTKAFPEYADYAARTPKVLPWFKAIPAQKPV